MTINVPVHGGPAQPVRVSTDGKTIGRVALRAYGFTSEADAIAEGYRSEAGPAMSVTQVTQAQLDSGQFVLEGDPKALPIYNAPADMRVEGGYSQPIFLVGGTLSSAAFDPASIAGLTLWLKSDVGTYTDVAMTTPAVSDNDVVAAWADQSGNNNHCTQVIAGKCPVLKTNIQAGKSILRSTQAGATLLLSPSITGFATETIFIVAKHSAVVASAYVFDQDGGSRSIIADFVPNKWEWFDTPRTEIANISRVVFQVISTTVGNASINHTWGIFNSTGSVGSFDGDIAEILVYDSVLSAGNISAVTNYLETRWGI